MSGSQKIMTGRFVLAWSANFFQGLVFYALITTMALYAAQSFAASDAAAGFAASAFLVGATVARLMAGYLVDVVGRHRVLLIATALTVLVSLAYAPVHSWFWLVVVRIVHGACFAVASTAAMATAQAGIPAARRAEGTGYLALGTTLSTAVGPAAGLALFNAGHVDWLFWAVTGVNLLSFLFALPLGEPRAVRDAGAVIDAVPAPRQRYRITDVMHPAVAPIGAFMLLVGLAYSGVMTYMNGYAAQAGFTTGASFFFLAYALVMFIMRLFLGQVQDRKGDNVVVALGIVAFIAGLLTLAAANSDAMVVAAGALCGAGFGSLMPAAQAIAVRLVPAHRIGTGISTLLLLTDIGVGLGPVALGVVIPLTGYSMMYVLLAGVVVLAAGLYSVVHGRRLGRVPVPVDRNDEVVSTHTGSIPTV